MQRSKVRERTRSEHTIVGDDHSASSSSTAGNVRAGAVGPSHQLVLACLPSNSPRDLVAVKQAPEQGPSCMLVC